MRIEVPINEGTITIEGQRNGSRIELEIQQSHTEENNYKGVDFKTSLSDRAFEDLYQALSLLRD